MRGYGSGALLPPTGSSIGGSSRSGGGGGSSSSSGGGGGGGGSSSGSSGSSGSTSTSISNSAASNSSSHDGSIRSWTWPFRANLQALTNEDFPSAPVQLDATLTSPTMVAVGISAAIIGALSASFGLMLIKSGNALEVHLPWYKRRRWLMGFVLQAAVSSVTNVVAFSTCPLSLISPLYGLTLAFSALWASLGIFEGVHEMTSYAEMFTIGIIFMGVTLSSIFGPYSVGNGNLDHLGNYLCTPQFICLWLVLTTLTAGWTLVSALPSCRHVYDKMDSSLSTTISALAAAASAALSLCCLKVAAMLVPYGIDRGYLPGTNGWVWLCIAGIAVYACTHLYLLNELLSRGRTMFAVPIFSSCTLLLTMTCSAVLFGDFYKMSFTPMAGFLCGAALVILGALLLHLLGAVDVEESASREEASDQVSDARANKAAFFRKRFVLPPSKLATASNGGEEQEVFKDAN